MKIFNLNNLSEDVTPVLECDFEKLLPYYNSVNERSRAYKQNTNLVNAVYPLTKTYLQNYYDNTNFYLKSFYPDRNCASSIYSYFVQSFGATNQTSGGGANASGGVPGNNSSIGINPLFGFKPFSFDDIPLWLWLVLIGAGIILIKKS
jgi:hypothetical protein